MKLRRQVTPSDRSEISSGLAGWGVRRIAAHFDRSPSVISREIKRNRTKADPYKMVHADVQTERARRRPQATKIEANPVPRARVLKGLGRSPADRRALVSGSFRPPCGHHGPLPPR